MSQKRAGTVAYLRRWFQAGASRGARCLARFRQRRLCRLDLGGQALPLFVELAKLGFPGAALLLQLAHALAVACDLGLGAEPADALDLPFGGLDLRLGGLAL